jgi:predicted esterase
MQYPQFMSKPILSAIFLLSIFSCGQGPGNTERSAVKDLSVGPPAPRTDLAKGTIVLPQVTRIGNRIYSLYLPEDSSLAGRKLPAMIFLDPHADGQGPLQRYRSLADRYGFMLIGSMDMKNGRSLEEAASIVDDLVREAGTRLPADPSSITLVGFSGGAKAALATASGNKGINAVIYCGAALPPANIPMSLPALGMTGSGDMNFSEVLAFYGAQDSVDGRQSLLADDGKHEWPDETLFENAFIWSLSRRCRARNDCDTAQLLQLSATSDRIRKKIKDPFRQGLALRHHIICFNGLTDISDAQKELALLTASDRYSRQIRSLEAGLTKEKVERQELMRAFSDRDLKWWRQRIKSLQSAPNDPVNRRLLGFVSLGAYSFSRNSLDRNALPEASNFLKLYRLADPKNSEWAFLSACLSAQSGDRAGVLENLRTSIRLGLDDPEKLRNEPLLKGFIADPEVAALIRKVGH